jgi:hypothetical protein
MGLGLGNGYSPSKLSTGERERGVIGGYKHNGRLLVKEKRYLNKYVDYY